MNGAIIHLLDSNNQSQGPYSLAEVSSFYEKGLINENTLAYVEGLPDWSPLTAVIEHLEKNRPTRSIQPIAPQPIYQPQHQNYSPNLGTVESYSATVSPPIPEFQYAPMLLRLVARIIDGVILNVSILVFIAITPLAPHQHNQFDRKGVSPEAVADLTTRLLQIVLVLALYYGLSEGGNKQGTIGKRMLGLKVCNEKGLPIGFFNAIWRYFLGNLLSCPTLSINFLMGAFNEKKQTLQDMILKTYVIRS